MAFKDRSATIKLTTDTFPEWAAGSFWELRTEKDGDDDDKIEALQNERVMLPIDPQLLRVAAKEGKLSEVVIWEDRVVMSPRTAALTHMSVAWGGDEFKLPKTAPKHDKDGKPVVDDKGNIVLDPYAGKVPPCTAEYIRRQDGYVLSGIYSHMIPLWAGRSPEASAQFPAGGGSVERESEVDGAAA